MDFKFLEGKNRLSKMFSFIRKIVVLRIEENSKNRMRKY